MTTDAEKTTLIEFPCTFPLKVMGAVHPEFESAILEAVRQHAPDTESHHITTRPSSKGNYVSATILVNVDNQEQLDNIYRALTSHELVKVVL
ncbi:HP0495 family protein [Neisseria perflava]|uniref:HP0495 family protein n=1 Tax=Neisseria perflava TaxID=33053 RepID=UPI0020A050A3|nr:YbeD family protein [Neisseria perflava]MCP1660792.1 putative lipoic acid-binding regulatory protein [Neisseria perflava]MCP1773307.1 putative lipoic acid-binding regulatory protein [Neisseria perflava]